MADAGMLTLDDVWELDAYEQRRAAFRRDVIALKKVRRVALGDRATLVFENRDTLIFQVQEMLRVERLRELPAIQGELDVYNDLMPGPRELSATLFIEITDAESIRTELDRLVGLDEHVSLVVGDEAIPARFDPKQMEEDRISAVQYVRFPMSQAARAALADPSVGVQLRVDHPNYTAETELGPETRASLAADLAGDAAPLLPRPPAPPRPPREDEWFREGGAVALRPAEPRCPGHVVVQPAEAAPTWLDAPPELLADCQRAVQRAVRELSERYADCRIESASGGDAPLRFDVLPRA